MDLTCMIELQGLRTTWDCQRARGWNPVANTLGWPASRPYQVHERGRVPGQGQASRTGIRRRIRVPRAGQQITNTCTSNDVVTGTSCNIGPSYSVGTGPSYNVGTGTSSRCNVGTCISTTCSNPPGCCHPRHTWIIPGTINNLNQVGHLSVPQPLQPPVSLCTSSAPHPPPPSASISAPSPQANEPGMPPPLHQPLLRWSPRFPTPAPEVLMPPPRQPSPSSLRQSPRLNTPAPEESGDSMDIDA